MPDTIHQLDIIHEATFAEPAFGLPREFPPVIKVFYDTSRSRVQLNTEHTTVASTNTLSDFVIRIGMFNNVAAVELRVDKMLVRLPTINNQESIAIAKDTIAQSRIALANALPEVVLNSSNFVANAWIALEGGTTAAERLLSRCANPATPLDFATWGADTARHGLRLVSRNDLHGWTATIFADPSLSTRRTSVRFN